MVSHSVEKISYQKFWLEFLLSTVDPVEVTLTPLSNRPKIEGHTIIDLTALDAMASLNLTGWNVQHEFAKGRLRFLPVPRIQIIISENLFFTRFKKVSKNKVFSHQFYIWKTRGHFTASLLDFSFQGILKKIRSQAQCFRIDSK